MIIVSSTKSKHVQSDHAYVQSDHPLQKKGNSADPDEMVHFKTPHLDLHCL